MSDAPVTDSGAWIERRISLDDGSSIAARLREGSGPTLIWGHGLSSSMRSEDELGLVDWARAVPTGRIVRYDARGHGDSDSTVDPEAYRWDRLARDQLEIADELGVAHFVAGGASMGCATALFTALAAPERVGALVLVIPPTAWDTRREQVDLYGTMAELLDAGRIDVLVAGVDVSPTPDPFLGRTDWKDRARRTLRESDPVRLARVFRGAGLADLPERDALATIACPALILAWSGDPGHPVSSADEFHALLPDSELHVASTAGDVDEWSGRIARFLASSGAAPAAR